MAEKEQEKATESAPMESAAQKVRDAALWLIGAFGAVGTLLVAGLQLKGLGDVSGWHQAFATAGVAVALAGITVAVLALASILLPHATTLTELEESGDRDVLAAKTFLNDNTELLPGFSDVAELYSVRANDLEEYRDAFRAWHQNPTKRTKRLVDKWVGLSERGESASLAATDWANYIGLRRRYKRRLYLGVIPGVIAVAIGASTFAIATAKPTTGSKAGLSGATLSGAVLNGAELADADLSEADLSGADLSFANLSKADLTNTNLTGADLGGANLEGAKLEGATLTDVIWSGTTCPDGVSSDDADESCEGHRLAKSE